MINTAAAVVAVVHAPIATEAVNENYIKRIAFIDQRSSL